MTAREPHRVESVAAVRATMVSCALNLPGMGCAVWLWRDLPGHDWIFWLQMFSLAVSALMLVALRFRGSAVGLRTASVLFILHQVPILAVLWAATAGGAHLGVSWAPFEANELGVLTIAIIAPPLLRVGVSAILLYVGAAEVQFLTLPAAARALMVRNAGWPILIYGGFALGLLIYRVRQRTLEQQMLAARAEAESLQRLARTFLAVRDLSNTPLQTLEIAVGLLRTQAPELSDVADRMDRAIVRLLELNHLLAVHGQKIHWRPEDESPDLERLIAESMTIAEAPQGQ